MVDETNVICASGDLVEGGKGVRFETVVEGETVPAFVVRFNGRACAYINRCAHVPIEMDWMEGEFFDDAGAYLICSTHGAVYAPDSGHCLGGPCVGKHLTPLPVLEKDGQVYLDQAGE